MTGRQWDTGLGHVGAKEQHPDGRREGTVVVVETDLAVGTPWAGTAERLDAGPGVRLVAASPGVRVYDVTRAQL